MHQSAMRHGAKFFIDYINPLRLRQEYTPLKIIEIGSMIVAGGSLREAAGPGVWYVGVDIAPGPGVDKVEPDPYRLSCNDSCCHVVVSSSTFEHAEFFWLTFLEMARVVCPGGYIYINAPSNGYVHRHPVDCWRFYPDAGQALTNWASKNGYNLELVETYIGEPDEDVAHWEDWVGIWRKV